MQRLYFIFFLTAALFLQHDLFAQDEKKSEFSLQGGLNWNNPIVKEDEFITDSKTGYQFGISYMRGKHFWWQTGLHYYHLASSFVPVSGSVIGDISYSEIKIPLLAGLSLLPTTNNVFNIRAFAGALPGFVVGKKVDEKLGIAEDELSGFHVDPTIGLDVDVLIVSARLGYAYGISSILKDYKSNPSYVYLYLGIGF
ncbi:MAG: hypothetical protein K1X61_00350 [Chitinophagales bacterium]|nr:hypothetical protein [Chitinophagales bacterium]